MIDTLTAILLTQASIIGWLVIIALITRIIRGPARRERVDQVGQRFDEDRGQVSGPAKLPEPDTGPIQVPQPYGSAPPSRHRGHRGARGQQTGDTGLVTPRARDDA